MFSIHGAGVGSGIAIGTAVVLNRDHLEIPEYTLATAELDREIERFRQAVRRAREKLLRLQQTVPDDAPTEIATFIDAHVLMLDDPLISERPVLTICEQNLNAEKALQIQAEVLIEAFDKIEDAYLRSKRLDVEQVVHRVYDELMNVTDGDIDRFSGPLDGQIVVTNDLAPADAVSLKNRRMRAFVSNLGSPISHTAILARSLRIPAIVGLHGAIRYLRNGDTLIVDGRQGVVLVDPDRSVLTEYRRRQRQQIRHQRGLKGLKNTRATTRDGETISLMANIELPGDIDAVKQVGASGVGLYRTEFLFMNRVEPPSEDEQYEAYRHVVGTLACPVVVRTLDLGADKQVDGGRASRDTAMNPALGLRAVRLCLREPGLFRPQLRAIYRASAHGSVQLMVPMMTSVTELAQVLGIIAEVKSELASAGHDFDPNVPVGGMIEVPAAAVCADLFAARLDFLSIGTNDLIQYTLAIDRVDDDVSYLYDPLHPSVLRLIRNTIRAGQGAGIPVAMCGEMAGDTRYTRLLLGLGLRVFSMDPTSLLEVKKQILQTDIRELAPVTEDILTNTDPDRVRLLVERIGHD